MNASQEFLTDVENFAKNELLEYMVLTCKDKDISMFISKAILIAIENAKLSGE